MWRKAIKGGVLARAVHASVTGVPKPPDRPLAERLKSIVAFLPQFRAPGFEFGHWEQAPLRPLDVDTVLCFCLSPPAESFLRAAYGYGWVVSGFNWFAWAESSEASSLRDGPEGLRSAAPEQLAYLLTVCVRQDSIDDGVLLSAFEGGLLTRILERAAVILSELAPEKAGS